MEKQLSPAKLRQRKFLLVLPLLIIPFLALIFWALGGGKVAKAQETQQAGLNMNMPNPVFKDEKGMDKFSFYEEVQKDSLKLKEQEKNDPFFFKRNTDTAPSLSSLNKYTDPNEAKVYAKLSELRTVMQQQQQQPAAPMAAPAYTNNADVGRLEQMLRNVQLKSDDDTELVQLNKMMDKLMALQNPKKDTPRVQKAKAEPIALVGIPKQNGFYTAGDAVDTSSFNAVRAAVAETQTLVNGSTIKLILEDNIVVSNKTIAKNSFVYGTVSLNNERLKITISSVRAGNNIIPVSLEGYDLDGMAGIYIPGSINRDVAKQSADESMNGMGLATLDPSIGAQAASAGIQAAKSLIGKKIRLIKVTVRAGYQILLQQNN
ncbi:MAG TPA: conjugative transposon protein TraM [Chitinophagaceae bacterium]|nr:conjugative transposon protein TraM [Chitinophagaceae bacterium]